jgi:putative flippase GtrA
VRRLRDYGPVLGQMIRFGIVGGFSTLLYAVIYLPLATYVMPPVLAVVVAFAIAVCVGYLLHSRWSFRGHGRQERSAREQTRFLVVQGFGMLLNAAFTWVLTGPHSVFHGPTWWPLVPAVTVTPLATFALNRQWVFG